MVNYIWSGILSGIIIANDEKFTGICDFDQEKQVNFKKRPLFKPKR